MIAILYDKIIKEREILVKDIKDTEELLKGLPNGKFICTRNDTRFKWYCRDGAKLQYIPKSEQEFAKQLAKKKYLLLKLESLNNEMNAIDAYLSKYNTNKCSKADNLLYHPGYNALLGSEFKSYSEKVEEWCKASYNKNPKYTEKLIYKTISGGYVRSKSEEIIDMALYMNGIPFRYECELVLGENMLYPDFTILHPINGKIYYWEHFGMMDDDNYVNNACAKLKMYAMNGILPSVQLITTYETKNSPLSSETVNSIIKQYF